MQLFIPKPRKTCHSGYVMMILIVEIHREHTERDKARPTFETAKFETKEPSCVMNSQFYVFLLYQVRINANRVLECLSYPKKKRDLRFPSWISQVACRIEVKQ